MSNARLAVRTQAGAQLVSRLLSVLVKVLRSPRASFSLLREQAEGRQACGSKLPAICKSLQFPLWQYCLGLQWVSLSANTNEQMHNFVCNCKLVVWGFSTWAAFSCLRWSVVQKSSHLWQPRGHPREVMEKCHLQVERHPGQLIRDMHEWSFLNSRGLPTLHRHHWGQVDVHTWKVKAVKEAILSWANNDSQEILPDILDHSTWVWTFKPATAMKDYGDRGPLMLPLFVALRKTQKPCEMQGNAFLATQKLKVLSLLCLAQKHSTNKCPVLHSFPRNKPFLNSKGILCESWPYDRTPASSNCKVLWPVPKCALAEAQWWKKWGTQAGTAKDLRVFSSRSLWNLLHFPGRSDFCTHNVATWTLSWVFPWVPSTVLWLCEGYTGRNTAREARAVITAFSAKPERRIMKNTEPDFSAEHSKGNCKKTQ